MSTQILQGLGVSEGVAIGRAVCIETRDVEVYRFPLPEGQVNDEARRFRKAAAQARREVEGLAHRVGEEMGADLAGIFEAHGLLLRDQHLLQAIEKRIREEKVNAEWAVIETTSELRERFANLRTQHFRDHSEDLQDVGRHLVRALRGHADHDLSELVGDVIVVADDLTPSDAVRLGRQGVAGFAIEVGGRTSHTAIIAHSLDIPLVTGLPGITRLTTSEEPIVVDGSHGTVILHPTAEILDEYRQRRASNQEREALFLATRDLPAVSRDGVTVTLMANIDLTEELDDAVRYGAEGIGLYRSEFIYIERSPELPDEEDHYQLYRRLIEGVAPNPVVIRTYDLGGRKLAQKVMEIREDNPVLGLRGIRLTLARPQIFRTQLRGLFRAGCHGDLWVLLPLVSTVDEVRAFRHFSSSVMDELRAEGVPFCDTFKLGVMIEVPSAALIADHLSKEVDFLSIGTNDLIQYSLAVDRNNEHVTHLYQPLHPALLRMIRWVVEKAEVTGIPVSVCGEMAADPLAAAVLLGLGIRRLSISPRRIPMIKTRIRELDLGKLGELTQRCMELPSAGEVQTFLAGELAGSQLLTSTEDAHEARQPRRQGSGGLHRP